jgi:hypothetical protein
MGAHIGALIEIELVLQGQDVPVGIDRGTGVVALLARVIKLARPRRRCWTGKTGPGAVSNCCSKNQ